MLEIVLKGIKKNVTYECKMRNGKFVRIARNAGWS